MLGSWWRHQMETFSATTAWPFVRGIHRSPVVPPTKASDAELWCFLWSAPDQRLSKQSRRRWFEMASNNCQVNITIGSNTESVIFQNINHVTKLKCVTSIFCKILSTIPEKHGIDKFQWAESWSNNTCIGGHILISAILLYRYAAAGECYIWHITRSQEKYQCKFPGANYTLDDQAFQQRSC